MEEDMERLLVNSPRMETYFMNTAPKQSHPCMQTHGIRRGTSWEGERSSEWKIDKRG